MINPFAEQQQDHLLFRRNYRIINQPTINSEPLISSPNKKDYLSQRNLVDQNYTNHSHLSPVSYTTSASFTSKLSSPSYSASKSPLKASRLIDRNDWKKDLENKERKKLQLYGAEGLRYNAYLIYNGHQQTVQNEYYCSNQQLSEPTKSRTHNIQLKGSRRQQELATKIKLYGPPNDSYSTNQYSNNDKQNSQMDKHTLQVDNYKIKGHSRQIYKQDSSVYSSNKSKREKHKYDISMIEEESYRQSNLKDMFESDFDDRLKRSMQHYSFISYFGDNQEMVQSKRVVQDINRTKRPNPEITSQEKSSVTRVQVIAPNSININGQIYQKIHL